MTMTSVPAGLNRLLAALGLPPSFSITRLSRHPPMYRRFRKSDEIDIESLTLRERL